MTDYPTDPGDACPGAAQIPATCAGAAILAPEARNGTDLLLVSGLREVFARRRARWTLQHQFGTGALAMLALVGAVLLPTGRAAIAETVLGGPITVGVGPGSAAVNPAANRIYVASAGVVSIALGSADSSGGNSALAVDPPPAADLRVIDGVTNTVIGSPITIGKSPGDVAFNPATNRIYVTSEDDNTVTVVDGATNTLVGTPIPIASTVAGVTAHPFGIGVNPTNNRIYVANVLNDTVIAIDGATDTVVGKPIPVIGDPFRVEVNPITNRIYVSTLITGTVTVIDGSTDTVMGQPVKIGTGSVSIGINPVTNRIYASSFADGTVTVIDGATNTVIGKPIPVGKKPGGVTVNSATNQVYVVNQTDNTVTVIDGATNAVVGKPIPTDKTPVESAINPTTNQLYVMNLASRVVTVIGVPLKIQASTATPGGAVTATWNSLFTPNRADFVGLFAPGAPNTSPLSRVFTNGTGSAGGAGLTDGSVELPIPASLTPGSYEVRLISGVSGGTLAIVSAAAPVATNDSFTIVATNVLAVLAPGVLANDTDAGSSPLQAIVTAGPAHGTLALQLNGAFTYTPADAFAGADTFTYRAFNQSGLPSAATVTITVVAPPVGTNDTFTVAAGATLNTAAPGVLANDTDADSPTLAASVVTNPAHGKLLLQPSGAFAYTPEPDFVGTDTFTYRASDGTSQSNVTTVTITVTPTACVPRPRVQAAPAASGGRLQVHVEATPLNTQQPNPLRALLFGTFQNAKVTVNGQTMTSGQSFAVPLGSSATDFTVERETPGQATTVPFTVVDGCGEWPTFVGGGTSAGF